MLGFYNNFPQNIHRISRFTTSVSTKRLQQTLVQTLSEVNGKSFDLEDIIEPLTPRCTVIFEFGIAETDNFNYFDNTEADNALKTVQKKPLQIMDFYCSTRYYKTQNERKKPLRFDYYMLRFIFDKNTIEAQVFHERGPRHMAPEALVTFIVGKINERSSKKILKAQKTS